MLTSKQRAKLRGLANSIDTIIFVGKSGIDSDVYKSCEDAIKARELIKGKVLESSGITSREAADDISNKINADVVQVIGTKFVLYKRNEKEPKIKI